MDFLFVLIELFSLGVTAQRGLKNAKRLLQKSHLAWRKSFFVWKLSATKL